MVILPFMKHGDLHAFLLASRIGENPFVSAWGGSGQEETDRRTEPRIGQRPWERRGLVGSADRAIRERKGSEFDSI